MVSIQSVEELKAKVREHGHYRRLAESTGLSESWIAKFATQPGTNYTLHSVQAIADYFSNQQTERAA